MNERDRELYKWLSQLPIELDSHVLRVDIEPLNGRACQVLRTHTEESRFKKDCFTADSRSAPAFKNIVLVPDIESFKCSISVTYRDGKKADLEAFLSDFH